MGFLCEVLSAFGFFSQVVKLIANCLENQHLSIPLNDRLFGFFKTSRGLRQGDPISHTLFILVEELLSRGLSSIFEKGLLAPSIFECDPNSCLRLSILA